jgi:hypothetical protein
VQDPEAANAIFELAFDKLHIRELADLSLVRRTPERCACPARRSGSVVATARRRDDSARMPWALTHEPNARSSVSLVDALLPGDILATSSLTRNTRTRFALGHVV